MPDPAHIITTVMFADICRSTYLFSELGDEKAAKLVGKALHCVAADRSIWAVQCTTGIVKSHSMQVAAPELSPKRITEIVIHCVDIH